MAATPQSTAAMNRRTPLECGNHTLGSLMPALSDRRSPQSSGDESPHSMALGSAVIHYRFGCLGCWSLAQRTRRLRRNPRGDESPHSMDLYFAYNTHENAEYLGVLHVDG